MKSRLMLKACCHLLHHALEPCAHHNIYAKKKKIFETNVVNKKLLLLLF